MRTGSGEFGGEAGFAEDSRADDAGALLAERFAAVLAKCNIFTIRMVCAVHTNPPSCLNAGSKDNKSLCGEGGKGLIADRLDQPNITAGGLAAAGARVGLGLFLVWFLGAGVLIVRLLAAGWFGSGVVLKGRVVGRSVRAIVVRGALQVTDAGFEFVDYAKIV